MGRQCARVALFLWQPLWYCLRCCGDRPEEKGTRPKGPWGGPLGLATGAPRDEGSLRKLRVLPSSSSRRDGKIDRRTQMRGVVREMEKECPL